MTIAFALSNTEPANGKIKTGTNGLSFMLHSGTGVISDVNGAKEDHEAFINATSVFSAGNKVKAVFNPTIGRFSLLINTGDKFIEWFSMEGLEIPTENVYFGLEISGKVNATFYGFELYFPSDPDVVGQNITRMTDDQGIMGNYYGADLTYDEEGVTMETTKKVGFDPYATIFTTQDLEVKEGQMIAVVLEELKEYVPGVNRLQIFGFSFIKQLSDNVDHRQSSFGRNNVQFSMDYDTHGRYVYDLCADTSETRLQENENEPGKIGNSYSGGKTLGDAFTFADIINEDEYGTSYMACYDPYNLMYYLYKKTFTEPDYTLISTVNLNNQTFQNDTLGWEINPNKQEMLDAFRADENGDHTFYGAVRLVGGMTLKAKDLKAFVIDQEDVGARDVRETMTAEDNATSATLVAKGMNLSATQDGYVFAKDSVKIPDGFGLVMEYDIENVSYLAGTYNIGWIITNDKNVITSGRELADATKIDNNITVQNSAPAATSKYSLLQFTGSSDLTPSFADNMRDALDNTGTSFRVIFYNNGTMKLQTKLASAYEWKDIEYGEAETGYVEGDPLKQHPNNSIYKYNDEDVYVGIRLQATYNLDVTDELKIYMIEENTPYTGGVSVTGGNLEVKPGTLRFADVKVNNEDETRGSVKVTGNENIDDAEVEVQSGAVYIDSTVTLVATANPGYAFEGWYLDGVKVSGKATADVSVLSDSEYEAKFVEATKVSITNGADDEAQLAENYYKNDDYIRIRPIDTAGFKFAGWNVRLVEVDLATSRVTTKESYDVLLKATQTGNMLPVNNEKDEAIDYNVWGTVVNNIVDGEICTVSEDLFYNVISFGSFSVKDRAGFENGDLMLMIPGLTCDYKYNAETEKDEMTVERKIIVEAIYNDAQNVTSIRDKNDFSEQYKKDMETVTMVGICFIVVFIIGLALLIALKKYVSYKKDIKALLEYEFVLKENDKL